MTSTHKTKIGIHAGWTLGEKYQAEMEGNLRWISALLHGFCLSNKIAAPPVSPQDGDIYIIAAGATGAWAGKEDYIAVYSSFLTQWEIHAPEFGLKLWVFDNDGDVNISGSWEYVDSTGWAPDYATNHIISALDAVIISAGNADYEFSEREANATLKIMTSTGNKPTITWPVGTWPVSSYFYNAFASTPYTLEDNSGSNQLDIVYGNHDVLMSDGVALLSKQEDWVRSSSTQNYSILTTTQDEELADNGVGVQWVFDKATPVTMTILDDDNGESGYPPNSKFHLFNDGVGVLTLVGESDVEIIGNATFNQGEGAEVFRQDDSNVWRIMRG